MQRMQSSVLLLLLFVAALEIIEAYDLPGPSGGALRRGSQRDRTRPYPALNQGPGPSIPNQPGASTHQGTVSSLNIGPKECIAMQIHTFIKTGIVMQTLEVTEPFSSIPGITIGEIEKTKSILGSALLEAMTKKANANNGQISFTSLLQLLNERRLLVAGLELIKPIRNGWLIPNLSLITNDPQQLLTALQDAGHSANKISCENLAGFILGQGVTKKEKKRRISG